MVKNYEILLKKYFKNNNKKSYYELKKSLFEIFKISPKIETKEIIEKLKKEFEHNSKYEVFETLIKEIYEDPFFLIQKILEINSNFILDIFIHTVQYNDLQNLPKEINEILTKNEIISIALEIKSAIYFCIENNKTCKYLEDILINEFAISNEITDKICNIFSKNIIEFKFNYLIQNFINLKKE